MVFIRIVKLFSDQDTGEQYVAVAHVNIFMNNIRKNLETIRKIIMYVRESSIDLLITPYFEPYGPLDYSNLDKKSIKKYGLTIRSGYLSELLFLAKNCSVNILLPGFVENAGIRLYLSAALFREDLEEVFKYRKIFLNEYESKLGFSKGSELGIFKLYKTSFSIMLDSDLYYPEISRILLFFTDFLVVGIPQNTPLKNYLNIVKTISQTNTSIVIIPGSRVYHTDKLYYSSPTVVIDENGDIVYRYSEDEQAIILIPFSKLVMRKRTSVKDIETIYSLYKKYLRKRSNYGDRESISY